MPIGKSLVSDQWSVVAFTTQILHGNNGFTPANHPDSPYADNISEGKANQRKL